MEQRRLWRLLLSVSKREAIWSSIRTLTVGKRTEKDRQAIEVAQVPTG